PTRRSSDLTGKVQGQIETIDDQGKDSGQGQADGYNRRQLALRHEVDVKTCQLLTHNFYSIKSLTSDPKFLHSTAAIGQVDDCPRAVDGCKHRGQNPQG